jgi:hypothetical protein
MVLISLLASMGRVGVLRIFAGEHLIVFQQISDGVEGGPPSRRRMVRLPLRAEWEGYPGRRSVKKIFRHDFLAGKWSR